MDDIRLDDMIKVLNKIKRETSKESEAVMLTFEFICASFFPEIYNNITEKLRDQYIKGYNESLDDKVVDFPNDFSYDFELLLDSLDIFSAQKDLIERKIIKETDTNKDCYYLESRLHLIEILLKRIKKIIKALIIEKGEEDDKN